MRIGIDCRKIADYGIGSYIQGLLRELPSVAPDDELVLFLPPELLHLTPSAANVTTVDERSPHYSVTELIKLRGQIRKERIDLFHAPHYVVPFTSCPLVVTIHDLIHLDYPKLIRNRLAPLYASWMVGRAIATARTIFTVSDTVRRAILGRYPHAGSKLLVTPNAVNSAFTMPVDVAEQERVLAACGLTRGKYFVYVGNDKPHKNTQLLLEAFLAAAEDFPEYSLAFVGRAFPSIPDLPNVIKTGYVTVAELHALYAGSRALVLPSLYEGFGLPVLEAMASGTAVIASDGGALPEVCGDAALIFPAHSVRELQESLQQLVRDESLRRGLVERGRKRAASFSWRLTAERTHAAYRRALGHD